MAFEAITYSLPATPNRVFAMLKLIETLQHKPPNTDLIFSLLQPDSIQTSKETAKEVYGILQNLQLITATDASVQLKDDSFLSSYDDFRLKMQKTLLGATQPEDNNYLFCQLTAWYTTYNHRVLSLRREDIERRFHEDLYPSIISSKATRKINDTILLSWGLWARFLGFGREYAFAGGQRKLLPNAYVRIHPLLPMILPSDGSEQTIDQFLNNLATHCPELDGGIVYNKVFESVHGQSASNAPLSLMLSTALRTLNSNNVIKLIDRADARRTRQLFPSESYLNRVSHICLN